MICNKYDHNFGIVKNMSGFVVSSMINGKSLCGMINIIKEHDKLKQINYSMHLTKYTCI